MAQTHLQQYQISGSLVSDITDGVSRENLVKSGRTLFDDLNSLRTQVKGILGSSAWTDEQAISLHNLKAQLTGTLMANSASFSGTVAVAGNTDLNGALDVAGQVDLAAAGLATAVRGTFSVAEGATFSDSVSVAGILDVNSTISASALKIDGDTAQRLYIVDADGSMKDEANMTFDGSTLAITGAVSGSGNFLVGGTLTAAGSADLNGSLDVAGAVDLAAAGVATSIRGTLSVAEVADFNGGVTANSIKIDSDVAQRLYIVDSDGSLKDEANMTFDGSTLKVTGAMSGSGALSAGGALTVAGASSLGSSLSVADLATLNNGLTVNTAVADFNAGVTANEIKIDGDTAQRLYIVGASGELKDEANMTFDGSALAVVGAISGSGALSSGGALTVAGASSLGSTLSVADLATLNNGLTVNTAVADFNAGVTASEIKIDGDTAQRLYIVGASGELKDEANMTFDGSTLKVTGAVSGSGAFDMGGALTVAGSSDLNGALDVAGQVDLAAVGVATNVRGTLNVAQTADFNGGVTANEIKIDGDTATRLYIVGASGELKDESKLVFDGSELTVDGDLALTGDAVIAGNVQVDGDLRVKGSMTYIDTTNMRVQDAFIYLATGSVGTSDSGIVLHGGAGASLDLVLGQDGGAGEFIFGKADRSPDGDGEMNGIDLVPAWASAIKLGLAESALSGSLMVDGVDMKLSAEKDLKFETNGNVIKLGSDAEYDSFVTQFGAGASILGALGAGSGIGISFRKKVTDGSAVNGSNQLDMFATFGDRLRANGDAAYGLDVYLNGVMLAQGAGRDYTVSGTDVIQFGYAINSDDVITVVLRNAA